jgi:endonuclease III
MTNSQPEDINARLDRLEQRVGETWDRATINTETIAGMQQILQGLLTMTLAQQQTTANLAQSTASLERSVGQLTETVRTHDRQIQQILQYLRDRNGGSSPPA